MESSKVRSLLLIAPASFAMAAPTAEASPKPHTTPEQQIQALGKYILSSPVTMKPVILSKDKYGHGFATYDLITTLPKTVDSAGDFNFEYSVALKNGQPNPQAPRSLSITASSSSTGGATAKAEINYSLGARTHKWKVLLKGGKEGPANDTSLNTAISGENWTQYTFATENPHSQQNEKVFNEIYTLGKLIIDAAADSEPVGNVLQNPLPIVHK
jgi:hypothetical protein